MPQLWVVELMKHALPELRRLSGGEEWCTTPHAGGAYFFKLTWYHDYQMGEKGYPAFHIVINVVPDGHILRSAMRLEQDLIARHAVAIPDAVLDFFQAGQQVNVGFAGHDVYVIDVAIDEIPLPIGFERDNNAQRIPTEALASILYEFIQNNSLMQHFCLF
jgi:hypothetical protein